MMACSLSGGTGNLKVAIFSKHLLFLKGDELPAGAAEIGFDGIDLAVRKGGHVEPDRVREDLPKLVAAIRQHGVSPIHRLSFQSIAYNQLALEG